jgi:integrase
VGVNVVTNRHGYLRFRIFWKGRDVAISTRYRDDGPRGQNTRLVQAKALLIEEELRRGRPLHEAVIAVVGDCPPRLMPAGGRTLPSVTVRDGCEGYMKRLRSWKERGDARKSLVTKTQIYIDSVILPFWGDTLLADVTLAKMIEFQDAVFARMRRHVDPETGEATLEPIKAKTARNIIGGHFRAIIKRARAVHGVPVRDPFEGLEWPKAKSQLDPDPFTAEERDKIIDFYRRERPRWYPWIDTLFWTGLRQGESTPLLRSDYDPRAGTLSVTKSRDEGEENEPKTARSRRTIQLLPEALEGLRALPEPLIPNPDALLFTNADGEPINSKEWPKKSFYPVLRKLGIRIRKFYCTRHTFITELISRGEDLKAIAEYCGTSVAMIERSYGRWMPRGVDHGVRTLRRIIGQETGPRTGPQIKMAVGDGLRHGVADGKENGPTGNRTPVCDVRGRRPNR